jgi:hypothetical protein
VTVFPIVDQVDAGGALPRDDVRDRLAQPSGKSCAGYLGGSSRLKAIEIGAAKISSGKSWFGGLAEAL